MKDVLVCKTCLITDVKMFHLDILANAYSELTGLECDDATTEYVCYECAALLLKYQQFRTKCLKANQVISQFVGKYCKITETVVKMIDRKLHNLESTIVKFKMKENIFKEYHNESKFDKNENKGLEQHVKIESDNVTVANEIKYEVELYDDKDQAASDKSESLHLEDDISLDEDTILNDTDTIAFLVGNETGDESTKIKKKKRPQKKKLVVSEVKDEVELYDKDQGVSDDNELLHLEDDISLNENPIKILVGKDTEDESTDIKKKKRQSRNRLAQESVEERKNNSTINKGDYSFIKDYVTIVNLTPEEAKKEVLLRKESNNYKTSLYKCDMCYRGYGTLQTYENHMKKHNKEIGEYNCDYCHTRFSKQSYLRGHIVGCHTTKLYCKSCPYTCFDICQAKTHVNLHKGKIYTCEECGQIFSMPNSLMTHQRFKHKSEFVCALCGSTFGKERGLRLHINLLHKQESNEQKGPLCEECDVHFATETAWKRHLVLSSKHTVSNGCEVCGETYESKDALKRHARVVHPKIRNTTVQKANIKKTIKCALCAQTLIGRREYLTHMRTDHPEVAPKLEDHGNTRRVQNVCEVCGKMFKSPSFLTYHHMIHTGERPYTCSECGKGFKLKQELKIHLASHSSVRAYKCHLCDKTFAYQTALNKHVKLHLGIRPHKCDICEKAFLTPCEVKYHNQHAHQNVPWPKKRKKSACDPSIVTS